MAGSGCALHPTLQLAVGEQNWFVIALLSGAQPRPSRHTTEGWGQRGVTVVWFLVSAPPGSLSGFLLAWQKHGLGAATVAPVVHHRPSSLSCCTAPDCWCWTTILGLVTTKSGGWVDLEGWLAQVAHCTRPCSWPWAHSTSLWLRSFQVHNPDQAQQKCDTNACYRSLYQCQKNSWENSGCFVHSAEVLCAVRSPL